MVVETFFRAIFVFEPIRYLLTSAYQWCTKMKIHGIIHIVKPAHIGPQYFAII
jgi:hypothetical protein